MEQQMYKVQIDGEEKSFPAGTTYLQIAGEYQERYPHDIVLVYVNGKLQELGKKLKKDCTLHFVTTGEIIGNLTYRRGVSFLLVKAVYDTIGHDKIEQVRIHFSVDKGYYCTIKGDQKLDQELLARIEERMHEMADKDLSIRKRSVHTDEAVEMFRKYGMKDKERLFRYRRVSTVNIYSINEFEDYYYGYMVPSTGYLKYFKLYLYDEGFVVQMPEAAEPEKIPPFQPQNKLFHVLKESTRGGDMLGIETVGALNDYVTGGSANPKELLLVQEAMQEKKIAQIAEQIAGNPQKKFVLIAGPSSSGKTTFSRRLSIQLRVSGLVPHPISVDDYFKNRVDTPLDAEGKPNYECLEALDVELFNHDLKKLLAGERIELPTFNFKTGKREYNGHYMQLGEQDILVIEGIHCLNDALTHDLPKENKFKIYISALTQLNIDEHNRIASTDGRLSAGWCVMQEPEVLRQSRRSLCGSRCEEGKRTIFSRIRKRRMRCSTLRFYMSFRCSNSMRSRSYIVFRVIQRSTTRRSGCSNFSIIFWVSAANRCRTIRLCANLSVEAVLKYD